MLGPRESQPQIHRTLVCHIVILTCHLQDQRGRDQCEQRQRKQKGTLLSEANPANADGPGRELRGYSDLDPLFNEQYISPPSSHTGHYPASSSPWMLALGQEPSSPATRVWLPSDWLTRCKPSALEVTSHSCQGFPEN